MLRLQNVKREENSISAIYDPEDSGNVGFIKLSTETDKVIEAELSAYDEDMPIYIAHAVSALRAMVAMDINVESQTVMWY